MGQGLRIVCYCDITITYMYVSQNGHFLKAADSTLGYVNNATNLRYSNFTQYAVLPHNIEIVV